MPGNSELRAAIQASLTPDLLKKGFRASSKIPTAGHCYVASEAYYHLAGGAAVGLKPMFIKHCGVSHWFIRDLTQDEDIDLTAEQFTVPVPYSKAVGCGFLTRQPSKRAQELIGRVRATLLERAL